MDTFLLLSFIVRCSLFRLPLGDDRETDELIRIEWFSLGFKWLRNQANAVARWVPLMILIR